MSKGELGFRLQHWAGGSVLLPSNISNMYDVITSGTPLGNKVKAVADAVADISHQWNSVKRAVKVAADQSTAQQADSLFPRLRDLVSKCLENNVESTDGLRNLQQFLGKLKHWRAPTHDYTLTVGDASALRLSNVVVGIAMVAAPEASGVNGNVRITWEPS
jgi:hypothetical protein